MDRRTLTYLATALAALIVILVVMGLLMGGIDNTLVARARAELNNFEQARGQLDGVHKEVGTALKKEPDLFGAKGYDQLWPDELQQLEQKLADLTSQEQTVRKLLEEDDPDKSQELNAAVDQLAATRAGVMADAADIRSGMREMLEFKQQLDENISRMGANWAAIQSSDLSGLDAKAEQAMADWPGKKEDLQRRLDALHNTRQRAEQLWEDSAPLRQAAEKNELDDAQLPKLIETANSLQTQRETTEHAVDELPNLIDQLYWAWDQILTDVGIQENSVVTFRRKLKTVKVPANAEEGTQVQPQPTERWENITKAEYEKWKGKLGMTVKHKPGGKYDFEAEDMVQPAGYAYMASPEQGRNRYGYWDNRGGSNIWVWYGQYAFMRHMFWGPRYNPINSIDYSGFERARQSGRPYYGKDDLGRPRYGSTGTVTQTRYRDSRYVQTGGYKNSQYVKSGGTYRGRRYATSGARRTSGGSYRGTSRSRSGSRFGFGK